MINKAFIWKTALLSKTILEEVQNMSNKTLNPK